MPTKPERDIVLLLTHSGDYYTVDRVADALAKRGAKTFRFDNDRFPGECESVRNSARTNSVTRSKTARLYFVRTRCGRLGAKNLAAGSWMKSSIRSSRKCACASLSRRFKFSRWACTPLLDQRKRARVGSREQTPATASGESGGTAHRAPLLTNAAEQARKSFNKTDGALVAKLSCASHHRHGRGLRSLSIRTKLPKHISQKRAGCVTARWVFRNASRSAGTERIACSPEKFFVGAVARTVSIGGQVDWRRATPADVNGSGGHPAELQIQLTMLMNKLQLVTDDDIIRTPAGEYVFLEVNPGGEWGMLERDLKLPISEAIADALLA